MFRITLFSLLLLLTCFLNPIAQTTKETNDCDKKLGKSFISDGQNHQLVLQSKRYTKLNTIFLPHFRYRLALCNKSTQTPVEMRLKDDKGNILFSNNNLNEWNFQFDALLKASIELKLSTDNSNDEIVSLIIGYKQIEWK